MITEFPRLARRTDPVRVPRAVEGDTGLFVVDATWGVIQPLRLALDVETVGELEVIAHIRAGGPLVDCRLPRYLSGGTIPTAINIPHGEIVERCHELDRDAVTVVFCNGPQCPASSGAVNALLQAGWPARALAYYRGGIHDWVTLGLPLTPPARATRGVTRPTRGGDPADCRLDPAVGSLPAAASPIYTTEPKCS
jgi:rhodanese-related sulfurtransferase